MRLSSIGSLSLSPHMGVNDECLLVKPDSTSLPSPEDRSRPSVLWRPASEEKLLGRRRCDRLSEELPAERADRRPGRVCPRVDMALSSVDNGKKPFKPGMRYRGDSRSRSFVDSASLMMVSVCCQWLRVANPRVAAVQQRRAGQTESERWEGNGRRRKGKRFAGSFVLLPCSSSLRLTRFTYALPQLPSPAVDRLHAGSPPSLHH